MQSKKNIIIIIFIITIIVILFLLVYYKIRNNGNNIIKLNENIKDNILNISSYEAEIEVEIKSNKTTNKYILKQLYYEPNLIKQIVIEPKNLENLSYSYDGKNIKLENTNLSLSKIYEDYKYINENSIWLNSFIKNYNDKSRYEETESQLIIENNNKYNNYNIKQILYIEKKTGLPSKMEIYDNNKNTKVYIKYNEIVLNKINKNNMFE